ncbi:MAG: DegT/DnrJ/EryC1/StrS family aminotransferase [Pseudomonadota bacterium]|nr:DegT/DnrJ/EryC1/StrS family aminotransferase [Pseudomonadota bacterium]
MAESAAGRPPTGPTPRSPAPAAPTPANRTSGTPPSATPPPATPTGPGLLKRLVLRHYRRFAPALDIAGEAYAAAVVGYEAFDRHNADVQDALSAELSRVLAARSTFELWRLGKRFEADFARYCGRRAAIGTASGTAALQIALVAAGVGPGDEVITSAHTFLATLLAIRNTGARPVLVDPDPGDLCVRPEAVRRAITTRTRAIVPVHMHGHVADVAPLLALGLPVIEDCAQAHGATRDGQRVPIGPTGCFSFFASKPLGGAGNGGAIVTDDEGLAERAERARDPEGSDPIVLRAARTPSYIDPLEAAVLTARLPKLASWRAARAANAAAYRAAFAELAPVLPAAGVESAWYSFVVRIDDRDAVKRRVLLGGVETKIEYATPVHLSPTFADEGWRHGDFPVAEAAAARGLSLPLHPFLTTAERDRVITAVRRALRR